MRVDAHHHLWRYTPEEYSWIDDAQQVLRHDFLLADLEREATAAGVDATVAVQARQTLEETHWLLDLATQSKLMKGVVGWAPLSADNFPAILADLRKNPLLRCLRHVVQGEPEGFLNAPRFNRGISALLETGLTYDILIFPHQLPEATRFVDRHPAQVFVLDHIAKPDIRHNEFDSWNAAIRDLGRRENVTCKLSGMVTEADWNRWTPAQLYPYFDTVLDVFGPSRLMIGSDWPVLTVASNYSDWWRIATEWIAPLSPTERAQIEGEVANRIYQLNIK